jgi:hypothetical protein
MGCLHHHSANHPSSPRFFCYAICTSKFLPCTSKRDFFVILKLKMQFLKREICWWFSRKVCLFVCMCEGWRTLMWSHMDIFVSRWWFALFSWSVLSPCSWRRTKNVAKCGVVVITKWGWEGTRSIHASRVEWKEAGTGHGDTGMVLVVGACGPLVPTNHTPPRWVNWPNDVKEKTDFFQVEVVADHGCTYTRLLFFWY